MTQIGYAPGVEIAKDIRIPVGDGISLAADLYVPAGAEGPLPVVVEYQPYRKDEIPPGQRFYAELPRRGYIVARVETRGTGASGGTVSDEYTAAEQRDGHDAVEWLAGQPFCDGAVAMMGISYGGFTALQVAALQPPHLRAIVPMHVTDDRYRDDCHYVGGQPRLYYDPGYYGLAMVAFNALPPDPQWADDWAVRWEEHLEGNEPYLLQWLRHPTDGPYWAEGSVGPVAERILVPTLLIGGWADGYRNVPLRLLPRLGGPARAILGPWNHAPPDTAVPGPRIDHLQEVVRWLDLWCRDRDTGVLEEPPLVVYEQSHTPPDPGRTVQNGRWRAERSWPLPEAGSATLHLDRAGQLVQSEEPPAAGEDVLVSDATVGVCGGLWSAGVPFGLAGDQRPDEALSLTYSSEPLREDLHVLGRATATLHVVPGAAVLGFAVALADVAPDGSSQLVAKGFLNGTRRDSLRTPAPLEPGAPTALEIELDATAWRFAAGHRIRIAVANADWPNVWPTPEAATSRLLRGGRHPSAVTLPVVPAEGTAPAPVFAAAPDGPSHGSSEASGDAAPPVWRVVHDQLSRAVTVEYAFGLRAQVNPRTVLERQWSFRADVDPTDPASASAAGRHTSTLTRPEGTTAASSTVSLHGSATHVEATIELEVRVEGHAPRTRRWTESVPRVLW